MDIEVTREPRHESSSPVAMHRDRRISAAERAIGVRAEDMQPYSGLRYVAYLFRAMAIVLGLVLIAEMVTGLRLYGGSAVLTLLQEGGRLLVFAGLLWAGGDLALLLIDIGHDVRAARIVVGRLEHHALGEVQLPQELHVRADEVEG